MRILRLMPIGATVATVLVLGACGNGGTQPGVATAVSDGATPAPSATANVIEQYVAAQREWV